MSDLKFSHKWVAQHIADLPRSGIRKFFDLVNTMDDVISLSIGEPDFVTPWNIREATIYALNRGITTYTSNLGDLKLRESICRYFSKKFGGKYSPETECIVTVGVSEGLDILLRAVLNEGDEVLYQEPCYVSYAPCISMTHAVPVAVETYEKNGFALDVADLEKKVSPKTKVLLLNYPNNPTGAGLTLEDKKRIAEFAIKHDLLVISDEIYEEINYRPHVRTIAALPGMRERTVVLNGFSKAFAMTGFRIAFAVGPRDIIDAMMKIHQYTMLCASSFIQKGAIEALERGGLSRAKMCKEYEQRRNVIVNRLNKMGLSTFTPSGAFYVFPNISSTGLSSEEFSMQLLQKKKVAVVPGTAFGACGEGYVRCSYATSLEEIKTAMVRIQEFLQELPAKSVKGGAV
ncbi:MAG: aminotransferase class I/II-fold pyridoxal phosphate-dependent enzyme [Lentisphaeria bacterium]